MAHFRINTDMTTRLFDETIYHRKAKTRALACFLGGKERLEHFFQKFSGHAATIVGHCNHHIVPWHHFWILVSVEAIQVNLLSFNGQLSTIIHRIARIDREIQDSRFKLRRVNQTVRIARHNINREFNVLAKGALNQWCKTLNQVIHSHILRLKFLFTRECQKLLGKVRPFARSINSLAHAFDGFLVCTQLAIKQLQIANDHCEEIVKIMRQATR